MPRIRREAAQLVRKGWSTRKVARHFGFSQSVVVKWFAKMNGKTSLRFVKEAEFRSAFHFTMLQSDYGPEFGTWFVEQLKKSHRYTRIGKPNDNAHIERFN